MKQFWSMALSVTIVIESRTVLKHVFSIPEMFWFFRKVSRLSICVALWCRPGSELWHVVDCVEGMRSRGSCFAKAVGSEVRSNTSELAVGMKTAVRRVKGSAHGRGVSLSPPGGRLPCIISVTSWHVFGEAGWERFMQKMLQDISGGCGFPPRGPTLL